MVKATKLYSRAHRFLHKTTGTKPALETPRLDAQLVLVIHFFLHANERSIVLIATTTTPSPDSTTPVQATACPATSRGYLHSTAILGEELHVAKFFSKDKTTYAKAISKAANIIDDAHERKNFPIFIKLDHKLRTTVDVELFPPNKSHSDDWTFVADINKKRSKKKIPFVRPLPNLWIW